MELDVTLAVSVKLVGSIDSKTENQVYLEHLNKMICVNVPNSITKEKTMHLKGLGKIASSGKKGDLYLKFDSIDSDGLYRNVKHCTNCGQNLTGGVKFCSNCGVAVEVATNYRQRQQEWAGKLIKCPLCGEDIPSFTANCPACGHELRGVNSTNSIKEFAIKIENATTDKMKASLIRTFPIPNTREDILEFMILASTNIENSFQADISEAWSVKFEQSYEKAKVLYGELAEFNRCYDLFLQKKKNNNKVIKRKERLAKKKELVAERKKESIRREEKKDKSRERSTKFFAKNKEWILMGGIFIVYILFVSSWSMPHKIKEWELNKLVAKVEEYIDDGEYEKARIKANQIIDDSGWSAESEEKWDAVRESLLDVIEDKQATEEGKIIINFSMEDLVGQDYKEVNKKLQQQGFTNIKLETIDDLITGWLTKNGEVEEVTVNGRTDFKKTSYYLPNVEIIIKYHTY